MKAIPFPPRSPPGSRWRQVRPPPWLPHRVAPAPAPRCSRPSASIGTRCRRRRARGCRSFLRRIHGRNAFYTRKLDAAGIRIERAAVSRRLASAAADDEGRADRRSGREPAVGHALTEPLERYTRYCQTSSTTGRPLRWIDTNESWQWMLDCWKAVYRGARVGPGDRVFFPFSFGPFLGFWAGFEAGCQMGLHCVPGGGMSSQHAAGDDRRGRRDGRLLHADLRAEAGGGGRRGTTGSSAFGKQRPRADRGGRAGGQHPGDARADRAELGRARHRSPRADRGRARSASSAGSRPGRCTSTRASTSARCWIRSAATQCRTGSRASWS